MIHPNYFTGPYLWPQSNGLPWPFSTAAASSGTWCRFFIHLFLGQKVLGQMLMTYLRTKIKSNPSDLNLYGYYGQNYQIQHRHKTIKSHLHVFLFYPDKSFIRM
jgi:hypothetical protein